MTTSITRRVYRGGPDLMLLQDLAARRTAIEGPGTNVHPGDVAHRIYNTYRRHDPTDLVPIWEDEDGPAAFALMWHRGSGFEVVARPGLADATLDAIVGE